MICTDTFTYRWVQKPTTYERKVRYKNGRGEIVEGWVTHRLPDMRHPELKRWMREIDATLFERYAAAIRHLELSPNKRGTWRLAACREAAQALSSSKYRATFGGQR